MKKITTLILFLMLCVFSFNLHVEANSDNLVNIYFFHSDSCSHCREETKFLEKIIKKYSNVKIYKYEIHDKKATEVLHKASSIYNINTNGVPITIIGNKVYTGFSNEKSPLKFIKTIEYYSRHGYQDKLSEQLNLDLPTYEIKENDITLEDFINEYHNYNLLGIKTDNLNTSTIALFLGGLSSIHIIRVITIILVIIIASKESKEITKILFSSSYILLEILLALTKIINNNLFKLIIYFILIIGLGLLIIKMIKNRTAYSNLLIVMIVATIGIYIANLLDDNFIIFINIYKLHYLDGIEKIMYYSNFIVSKLTIGVILIYIGELIKNKITSKIIRN